MDARDDPGSSPDRSPSPKKRSAPKRVVSVPVLEAEAGLRAKPGSDAAPPPDSWAWRKYGQKPIKGSPYPRGYYRCSSAKGCPARKQVERSRTDPTQFIITYSSDHNHPWSLPKNHHHHHAAAAPNGKTKAVPADHTSAAVDPEENFSDLIVEEPSLLLHDEFRWPSNSAPEAADDGLLFGPFLGGSVPDDICEYYSGGAAGEEEEEEDGLFAGLGELPEWSVVFRRGFFDRQVRGGDEGMRCGLEADESAAAAAAAAASWCGSTG